MGMTIEPKNNKSVCFQDQVAIHVVPNQRVLRRREKAKRWFTNDEFLAIKEDCLEEIDIICQSDTFDIFRFRGLEKLVVDNHDALSVLSSVTTVVDQHDQQRQSGEVKPKELRKVYQPLVSEFVQKALENACVDHIAVKEYLATAEEELKLELEKRQRKSSRKNDLGLSLFKSLPRSLSWTSN